MDFPELLDANDAYAFTTANPAVEHGKKTGEKMRISRLTGGLTLAALLAVGPAMAQSNQAGGTTSGPAAGKNVEPSTVTQKKNGGDKSAASAGAPGTAAKKGSESGAAPDRKPNR